VWDPEASEEELLGLLERQLDRVETPLVTQVRHTIVAPPLATGIVCLAWQDHQHEPAGNESARYRCLLDGELYNIDSLRARLPEGRATPSSLDVLCAALIDTHGLSIVESFNGMFSLIVFDTQSETLSIVSDRLGTRAPFYTVRGSRLVFGTELKGIAVADPQSLKIDPVGLAQLFSFGSHLHGTTWVEGYSRLDPGTILTATRSGVTTTPYWEYRYREDAPRLDQPSYVTQYSVLFDRAVERCMSMPGRKGIFLSGGYDSRTVAAAIRPRHLPIPSFTFGQPESRDAQIAPLLAKRLGMSNELLSEEPGHLRRYCESIIWRTEGMLSLYETTSIQFHDKFKAAFDVLLTGFLGEFSGSHIWPKLLFTHDRRRAAEQLFARMTAARRATLRRIFTDRFQNEVFEEMHRRFLASFDAIDNEHLHNVADSWSFRNVKPQGNCHSPSIDRHVIELRCPHLDNDLVDFLLTIPPWERIEQRVYKKMIAYGFPHVRDIPCTNSNRPIDPNFAREYAKMAARYAGRKLWAPIERLKGGASLGREISDLNAELRQEPELVTHVLQPMLDGGIFDPRYFDNAEIAAIVSEHYEGRANHGSMLTLLISWGLASRYFLHSDLTGIPKDMYRA
jgi:asparagine synthase (glutamine-hydrolysing)